MKTQAHTPSPFQSYEPEQMLLLPPDLREWLPEGHLAHFVCDVVSTLDLSAIYASYDGSQGGRPAYDPRMMVSLLVYGYCVGTVSSRQIEKQTYESVPFRVISADQHPDHDTVAEFRKRHLDALACLFVEVLQLCRKAGLVKLGHVSLDGTKVKANASRHKAMSYGRMEEKVKELEEEVGRLLEEARRVDEEEDRRYGRGRRGDELPKELQFKQSRLEKIREAKRALEAEARAEAERIRAERAKEGEENGPRRGPRPKEPSGKPAPKAQRNFTDPESRIMRDGATHAFVQAYNCQAAVDARSQVILASHVTQEANDKQQLQPMVEKVDANLEGALSKERTGKAVQLSADAGYFSESNLDYLEEKKVDGYIATGKDKHGNHAKRAAPPRGRIPKSATKKDRMARKLRTVRGRATYSKRKESVEAVFGQIKQGRGFRQFLLRGLGKVEAEWDLICMGHNLLKLFRSGWHPAPTAQALG